MVSKEQALINYISLVKSVMKKFEKLEERVYSSPCLNYKHGKFFEEKDPFKIVLQWNMFYRHNYRCFYHFIVKDGINLIKKFAKKNKIDIKKLNNELKDFEESYKKSELMFKNITFIENTKNLNEKEIVKETLELFNEFKNIQFFTCEFVRNLDLKYTKRFYQFQLFQIESESIYWNYPDNLFNRRIEVEINSYIFKMIYENED